MITAYWTSDACKLYLNVIMWIPVGIIDDDGVCSCQIDAKTTSTRRQQEAECRRPHSYSMSITHTNQSPLQLLLYLIY